MPRPRRGLTRVTFWIEVKERALLKKFSGETGLPESQVIREILSVQIRRRLAEKQKKEDA
jgi:hypothetical protein